LTQQNITAMQVFTGAQAQQMIIRDTYPVGSIGVFKSPAGWAYWFWDGFIFDAGTKPTEEEAFRTAKKNWR
jgi:hypothetical protein